MQKGYPAPLGADEVTRLSRQDDLFNSVRPPLPHGAESPKRVLDVGCGSGGWLRLIAQAYSHAQCVGLDNNALLLNHARDLAESNGLSNVEYVLGDFFDLSKIFAKQRFDLIQMRMSTWFVGPRKHDVFSAIKHLLVSGGTFSLIDFEQPFSNTSAAWHRYNALFFNALEKRGTVYYGTSEFPVLFRELGFTNINLTPLVIDLGSGAPDVQAMATDVRDSITTVGQVIVAEGLLSEEEFDALRQQCFADMAASGFGMLAYFLSISGQKV